MSIDLKEKKKTAENNKNELISAKVIANYGDPGLDEDYQFDILSRFVIVAIESIDRVPTSDKWPKMIAVVKRPEHLWINMVGNQTSSPADQQRQDNTIAGNTNVGSAANYSVNAIPRINNPYQMGETIFLRKLTTPLNITSQNQDDIFTSNFSQMPDSQGHYNNWHNMGSFLPYITNGGFQNNLTLKTIQLLTNTGPNTFYVPSLNKYQYEAFALMNNNINTNMSNGLAQIFAGQWQGHGRVYDANGGYIFNNLSDLIIPTIEYEDSNAGQKTRIGANDCIPLIVTTPNTFPTPKIRSTGTINYNPMVIQSS